MDIFRDHNKKIKTLVGKEYAAGTAIRYQTMEIRKTVLNNKILIAGTVAFVKQKINSRRSRARFDLLIFLWIEFTQLGLTD